MSNYVITMTAGFGFGNGHAVAMKLVMPGISCGVTSFGVPTSIGRPGIPQAAYLLGPTSGYS